MDPHRSVAGRWRRSGKIGGWNAEASSSISCRRSGSGRLPRAGAAYADASSLWHVRVFEHDDRRLRQRPPCRASNVAKQRRQSQHDLRIVWRQRTAFEQILDAKLECRGTHSLAEGNQRTIGVAERYEVHSRQSSQSLDRSYYDDGTPACLVQDDSRWPCSGTRCDRQQADDRPTEIAIASPQRTQHVVRQRDGDRPGWTAELQRTAATARAAFANRHARNYCTDKCYGG